MQTFFEVGPASKSHLENGTADFFRGGQLPPVAEHHSHIGNGAAEQDSPVANGKAIKFHEESSDRPWSWPSAEQIAYAPAASAEQAGGEDILEGAWNKVPALRPNADQEPTGLREQALMEKVAALEHQLKVRDKDLVLRDADSQIREKKYDVKMSIMESKLETLEKSVGVPVASSAEICEEVAQLKELAAVFTARSRLLEKAVKQSGAPDQELTPMAEADHPQVDVLNCRAEGEEVHSLQYQALMAQYQDAIKAHTAQAARLEEFETAHITLQRQIQQIKNEKDAQIQSLKLQLKYLPGADSAPSVRETELASELQEMKKAAEHWETQHGEAIKDARHWQHRHQFVTEDLLNLQVEFKKSKGEMEQCQIILQKMNEQHRRAVQEAEANQVELRKQRAEISQLMEQVSKCERSVAVREREVDSLNQRLQDAQAQVEKDKLGLSIRVDSADRAPEVAQVPPEEVKAVHGSSLPAISPAESVSAQIQDLQPKEQNRALGRSVSPIDKRPISLVSTVSVGEEPYSCPTRLNSPGTSPPVVNRMTSTCPGETTAQALSLQRKSSPARVVSPTPSPAVQNRTITTEKLTREGTPSIDNINISASFGETAAQALSLHRKLSPTRVVSPMPSPAVQNRIVKAETLSAAFGETTAQALALQRKSSPARIVSPITSPVPSPAMQNRPIRTERLTRDHVISQTIDTTALSASVQSQPNTVSPALVNSPPTVNRRIQSVPSYSNMVVSVAGPGSSHQLVQRYSIGAPKNSQYSMNM